MAIRFIFPADMVQPKTVDSFFKGIFDYVKGKYEQPLVYSFEEDLLNSFSQDIDGDLIIYRGWVVTEKQYSALESKLAGKGAKLIVSTENYVKSQFGNNWYQFFNNLTPYSKFYVNDFDNNLVKESLSDFPSDSFVIKGVSKSFKHDWDNMMFIKNVDDFDRIYGNFIKETTEPSFMIRAFENWRNNEFRLWFYYGKLIHVDNHPDNPFDYSSNDFEFSDDYFLDDLSEALKNINVPLVNVDIVQDDDDDWRVVEVGNLQVSESPHYETFIDTLMNVLV